MLSFTSFFLFNAYNELVIDMNQIDPSKYEKIINRSKNINKSNNIKNYLVNLFIRTLVVAVILISVAIIFKTNSNLKDNIYNYFCNEEISFTKINKMYDKYLGGLLPIKKENKTTPVFNEKLNYDELSIYYDGVKLAVTESYLVPVLDEGMVVFVGEKDNYGNTVIIENLDGVDYWYGNISNTSLKLYDYVEKGSLIGEVNNDLYMIFSKDGNYLNYEEYIY